MKRVVAASFVGTTLEYYDFFAYSTAASIVFPILFFPGSDPATGLLLALATYAVGYVVRPLGAAIFGHFGDKIGRKNVLVTTLLLMGLASAAVGLLPTYENIGVWAPVLLVSLRFLQGIGIGGEWGGAALMVTESDKSGRRGFFGSLVQSAAPTGLLLATGIFTLMTSALAKDAFLAWGWRIPFLISFLLVAIGLYIRMKLAESPVFEEAEKKAATKKQEEVKAPLLYVFTHYKKSPGPGRRRPDRQRHRVLHLRPVRPRLRHRTPRPAQEPGPGRLHHFRRRADDRHPAVRCALGQGGPPPGDDRRRRRRHHLQLRVHRDAQLQGSVPGADRPCHRPGDRGRHVRPVAVLHPRTVRHQGPLHRLPPSVSSSAGVFGGGFAPLIAIQLITLTSTGFSVAGYLSAALLLMVYCVFVAKETSKIAMTDAGNDGRRSRQGRPHNARHRPASRRATSQRTVDRPVHGRMGRRPAGTPADRRRMPGTAPRTDRPGEPPPERRGHPQPAGPEEAEAADAAAAEGRSWAPCTASRSR